MKRNFIVLFILLAIIFGAIVMIWRSNPLRKSEEQIREDILKITPIGMSMDDVIRVIEDNAQWYKNYRHYEWFGKYRHYDYGFSLEDGKAVMRYHGYRYDDAAMIGKETIEATIGQYTAFFEVAVFAYWAFDENENLVDVAIAKDSDSF